MRLCPTVVSQQPEKGRSLGPGQAPSLGLPWPPRALTSPSQVPLVRYSVPCWAQVLPTEPAQCPTRPQAMPAGPQETVLLHPVPQLAAPPLHTRGTLCLPAKHGRCSMHLIYLCIYWIFETWMHHVAQVALECAVILLPQPPEC